MATATYAPPSEYPLYQWQCDNLIQATSSLNGHWHDANLPSIGNLNSTIISTDTRSIKQGDIFLALSGDNFDGHHYVAMAIEKGAVAVIVERELSDITVPQLIVDDSRLALGQLGAYRRQQHDTVKIIAVTGSSGKTTVKEMLGSIFNRLAPTLVTRGNLNNDLGVPMMMLELSDDHQYAILELGANHVGEIAYSAKLVQPDVASILNIGTAHLGEFGSRDNIAQAKAEIYQALTHESTAVVPDNDDYTDTLYRIAQQYTTNVIGFGQSDIVATDVQINDFTSQFSVDGHQIQLPLAGAHNVENALAVIACAKALAIDMTDIVEGLHAVKPPKGRLYRQQFGKHYLIDDAYNANPNSMVASSGVLASQTGHTILVLGDMGELGDAENQQHYQVGVDIAHMTIDSVYTVGELSQQIVKGIEETNSQLSAQAFDNKADLLATLTQEINQHRNQPCHVLFKASRAMALETVFDELSKGYANDS